jgi:hypothetical protein
MDHASKQLERLLDIADMRLMRLLERAIFRSSDNNGFDRALKNHRKELFQVIRNQNLVSAALQYLVIENNEEFIPRTLWQLKKLVGVGEAVLHHKHFYEGQRFISENFSPGRATICLFLPCHKVKPYSLSPTIQTVKSALDSRHLLEHVVMAVASVPGIVPIGLDRYYPFAYYNWDPLGETKGIISSYTEALYTRAREFIKNTKANFRLYIAYFRPQAVELQALLGAARDEGVLMKVVPHQQTVAKIRERNRALWRYAGLKRLECIADLANLLECELRGRAAYVSTNN